MNNFPNSNSTYNSFFAQHYDFFYTTKKPYQQEAQNLISLFKQQRLTVEKPILDIGCGTGEHALHIARQGYVVKGIDISPHMIRQAQEKQGTLQNVHFQCQSVEKEQGTYSYAYALFNVINCLSDETALKAFFEAVANALQHNGIFVFDCWHTKAILATPPRYLEDDISFPTEIVRRKVTPSFSPETLECVLTYQYAFKKGTEEVIHHIRLFKEETILTLLADCGFKLVASMGPLSECRSLLEADRYSTYVVQKC